MTLSLRALLMFATASLCAVNAHAQLAPGRFGKALAPSKHARVAGRNAYVTPPITVECWAKLHSKTGFNILVSNHNKTSPAHWEIYTASGTGQLAAYAPGCTPGILTSTKDIVDGKWHYVAMQYDTSEIRLFADGQEVLRQAVNRGPNNDLASGDLLIGAAKDRNQTLDCDGWIDEVRISRGIRAIGAVPQEQFKADEQTVGLWRLDKVSKEGSMDDVSSEHNPAVIDVPQRVSMDELDYRSFQPGPSPIASQPEEITLTPTQAVTAQATRSFRLDGAWRMAEGGSQENRLATAPWDDAIPATVPGSVHTALQKAGKIPDPKFGRNDAIAHTQSFKTWWLRRDFDRPKGVVRPWLRFNGVAIRCTVWLNGKLLGTHDGMFGGPDFDIDGLLHDKNTLVVRLDPAPGDPNAWDNPAWSKTVVFNNVWGWHYSSIPELGIWRSVFIEGTPAVRVDHPFVATRDAHKGVIDLVVNLTGPHEKWDGVLVGRIEPDNFKGEAYEFTRHVTAEYGAKPIHLRFRVPNPRLWWPNGLGAQDLYRLTLSFKPVNGVKPDVVATTFGIRTIRMAPLPGGPRSTEYNWTFVVNGKPTFIKGAGWCTMDSSMNFSRTRYDRLLTLAADQHIQMLRGWGSGMPETDEFYDLCDRKGIMVMQEWPTAWDSHLTQPYDLLEDTVRRNILRIRNHPSLAMYGGGNESGNPFGKAIDMMGRYAVELDGTRPFHRAEPWGGSAHNYDCYWGYQHLDRDMTLIAPFFGEFGLACMPNVESVLRYLPENEKSVWPPSPDGSLAHHTPKFNTAEDMKRLFLFANYFSECSNLDEFVTSSQLSQAVGVMHTLERARTRWPDCTGALYYKMNDNYPAASWSCVDWYGAPKLSHYFFQRAFAPLHACVLYNSLKNNGKPLSLPVYLLDDANRLKKGTWQVTVRAYNSKLLQIKSQSFAGNGATGISRRLGSFTLTANQTITTPLFMVTEVRINGKLVDESYNFTNFEATKGCLFNLPRTHLTLGVTGNRAVVTNTGLVPAVGVAILRPGYLDTFRASANYLWLAPGESRTITVSEVSGLTAGAWNADEVGE